MNRPLFTFAFLAFCVSTALSGTGPGPWANGAYFPGQLDGRYSATVYNNVDAAQSVSYKTNTFFTTNFSSVTTISNAGGLLVTNVLSTNVVVLQQTTNSKVTPDVVSGILGFGIRNGTPSVGASSNSVTSSNSSAALQGLSLDPTHNYFLIYVNGEVYTGTTAAYINPDSGKIAGSLVNGAGQVNYLLFTNQEAGIASVANTGVEVVSLPSATASGYFNAKVEDNKSPYTFQGNGSMAISSAAGGDSGPDDFYQFGLDGIKNTDNSLSGLGISGRNAP